ncbi:MAG: protease pro-enzyme activation domain-containing protein [Chthoniobacter sp.]
MNKKFVREITLACAAALATSIYAQNEAPRKVFMNSVGPIPAQPSVQIGAPSAVDHSKDTLEILFDLTPPKEIQDALDKALASGQRVSPKELEEKYGVPAASFDALIAWLKKENFQITDTSPGRTGVYARATVEQIEKSLQVTMVRVHANNQDYNAIKDAPSLPADIATRSTLLSVCSPFSEHISTRYSLLRQTGTEWWRVKPQMSRWLLRRRLLRRTLRISLHTWFQRY